MSFMKRRNAEGIEDDRRNIFIDLGLYAGSANGFWLIDWKGCFRQMGAGWEGFIQLHYKVLFSAFGFSVVLHCGTYFVGKVFDPLK